MIQDKSKIGVALVKEACPMCSKPQNGPILMNTVLSEKRAEQVEQLHGQCIGYSEQPCDECRELMSKGFLLIEVDEDKTTDRNNPWRTGRQWVITHDAAHRIFQNADLSRGAAFITAEVVDILKLSLNETVE